jgi:hypothetical protein
MTIDPDRSIANYLLWSETLLEKALADESMRRSLARIGYDEVTLRALQAEHAEVVRFNSAVQLERDQHRQSSAALDDAIIAAQTPYARAVELARALFRSDIERMGRFGLLQRRLRSTSGWLDQARSFFHVLTSDQQAIEAFEHHGVSRGELENDAVRLNHVAQALAARDAESAEAREALRRRDAALDAFDEKIDRFVSVARALLKEQPLLLDKLGLD